MTFNFMAQAICVSIHKTIPIKLSETLSVSLVRILSTINSTVLYVRIEDKTNE